MPDGIYYIRGVKETALPTNLLILDTETSGNEIDGVAIHKMDMAWTWRMTLSKDLTVRSERWDYWDDAEALGDFVAAQPRSKAPLVVAGSNITFDLFASGLAAYFQQHAWKVTILYDKGLTTIIRLKKGDRHVTFIAVQNFLAGGVAKWGDLLGKPKLDVDPTISSGRVLSDYCRRDTEITGLALLHWLRFVRDNDMGGFAHTRASQSFRCWRHRFRTTPVLHYDQQAHNAFVRRAYYGGRVECFRFGEHRGVKLNKWDINSMYPAVMRDREYPTKLKQWFPAPTTKQLAKAMAKYLVIAEVELDTDEPAYPVRRDGKLLFPLGRFRAWLPTESFAYALDKGHVTKVDQLMTFEKAKLFDRFVDEWYQRRLDYQLSGDAVNAMNCKLILNSLYGKFGELREQVISEGDDTEGSFYRRLVDVERDLVHEEPPLDDWHYYPEDYPDEEYVSGVEWAAWGKFQITAGKVEGPYSMPAIAAHVTDYGRMQLYRLLKAVGLSEVYYCDTDSLIAPEGLSERLDGFCDDTKLGYLKVEASSDTFIARGPKDYTFGEEVKRKGIRASADEVEPGVFEQPVFPGLYSLLRAGSLDGFPIGTIRKRQQEVYTKGVVSSSGRVTPFTLGGIEP